MTGAGRAAGQRRAARRRAKHEGGEQKAAWASAGRSSAMPFAFDGCALEGQAGEERKAAADGEDAPDAKPALLAGPSGAGRRSRRRAVGRAGARGGRGLVVVDRERSLEVAPARAGGRRRRRRWLGCRPSWGGGGGLADGRPRALGHADVGGGLYLDTVHSKGVCVSSWARGRVQGPGGGARDGERTGWLEGRRGAMRVGLSGGRVFRCAIHSGSKRCRTGAGQNAQGGRPSARGSRTRKGAGPDGRVCVLGVQGPVSRRMWSGAKARPRTSAARRRRWRQAGDDLAAPRHAHPRRKAHAARRTSVRPGQALFQSCSRWPSCHRMGLGARGDRRAALAATCSPSFAVSIRPRRPLYGHRTQPSCSVGPTPATGRQGAP